MGPPSYMQCVVDQNFVMKRVTVQQLLFAASDKPHPEAWNSALCEEIGIVHPHTHTELSTG